jgi:hypothetical protein
VVKERFEDEPTFPGWWEKQPGFAVEVERTFGQKDWVRNGRIIGRKKSHRLSCGFFRVVKVQFTKMKLPNFPLVRQ